MLATTAVIGADGEQPGELALAAGVGLKADGVVTGDCDHHLLELMDHRPIALGLVERGKRMHIGKLWPGDGNHLGCGVELHGA